MEEWVGSWESCCKVGDLGTAEGLLLGASQRGPSEAPQLTPDIFLPPPTPIEGA